jgi:hypothetical protein
LPSPVAFAKLAEFFHHLFVQVGIGRTAIDDTPLPLLSLLDPSELLRFYASTSTLADSPAA